MKSVAGVFVMSGCPKPMVKKRRQMPPLLLVSSRRQTVIEIRHLSLQIRHLSLQIRHLSLQSRHLSLQVGFNLIYVGLYSRYVGLHIRQSIHYRHIHDKHADKHRHHDGTHSELHCEQHIHGCEYRIKLFLNQRIHHNSPNKLIRIATTPLHSGDSVLPGGLKMARHFCLTVWSGLATGCRRPCGPAHLKRLGCGFLSL